MLTELLWEWLHTDLDVDIKYVQLFIIQTYLYNSLPVKYGECQSREGLSCRLSRGQKHLRATKLTGIVFTKACFINSVCCNIGVNKGHLNQKTELELKREVLS